MNSFFSESRTPPAVVNTPLHRLEEADRGGLLHDDRRVAGPERAHQQIGLRLLDRRDVRGEVGHPELGEELEHELHVGEIALEHRLVGLPAVMAVGIVVADAGDGLDALEVLRRQDAGDDRLDLVVHALEGPLWDSASSLRRPSGSCRPRRATACRDPPPPDRAPGSRRSRCRPRRRRPWSCRTSLRYRLDRIFGIRFFLDDQLHGPPEDPAGLVHALGPPLGAAKPGGADRRRDAGADDEDAHLHRTGRLSVRGPNVEPRRRGHAGARAQDLR